MKRWIAACMLLALMLSGPPAFAAGLIILDEAHWRPPVIPPGPIPPPWPRPPYPRPPQPHVFAPLDVNFVKVNTRIRDQIAATSIDQEFYNPNPARLEGSFIFPVPKGAHLDKFTMDIDGKQVEAELLSSEKARRIYEDIVRKLRDPALLEYADRDLFKVRIFPIEPHSKKHITLAYTQLLKSDDGLLSYVLPLNTEKYSAKPIKTVSVKVELETSKPLKSVYSANHAVEVKRDGPMRATAGYEASDVQPNEDFALYFSSEKREFDMNLLTHKTSGEDGYFLLLTSPGVDVKESQVVPKDVAFVLDTSGSMAGKKLEQAKKALRFCVENLNDGDRFEVVRFSTEVEPLFDKLVEATKESRGKAEEFIRDLKPTGGTAIDDALAKALSLTPGGTAGRSRVFVIIFLTDGRPTVGISDEDQIVSNVKRANDNRTRVFCFGIGTDVNTHLLDKITEVTRAASQYVLPEEDLEIKVSSFFSKIKEPVLANPTLKFTGDVRATKIYPSPLPDLFKGEQLVLVGRYSGRGDTAVVLEGMVNGVARKFTYEVGFPAETEENGFVPRLWATRRIGYLLDEIRLHGESSELRDEVTELARKYGVVTPYTAWLIMEDETRRGVPVPVRSLQSFETDREVRAQAEQTWSEFKTERTGSGAVADASYGMALKSAVAAPEAASRGEELARRRYNLPAVTAGSTSVSTLTPAEQGKIKLAEASRQARFVAGKNFFQNDNQWIDTAVQKNPNAKRVRIAFGSQEYFQLAGKSPSILVWLAIGQNVQFLLNDTIYEIRE